MNTEPSCSITAEGITTYTPRGLMECAREAAAMDPAEGRAVNVRWYLRLSSNLATLYVLYDAKGKNGITVKNCSTSVAI